MIIEGSLTIFIVVESVHSGQGIQPPCLIKIRHIVICPVALNVIVCKDELQFKQPQFKYINTSEQIYCVYSFISSEWVGKIEKNLFFFEVKIGTDQKRNSPERVVLHGN